MMGRKPNAFLAQLEAKYERKLAFSRIFTIQQCVDFMMIAANEEFGFGPERLDKLETAFYTAFREYAELTLEDAEDDREIVYTKAKLDRKLEAIMGEHFRPWEERYGSR